MMAVRDVTAALDIALEKHKTMFAGCWRDDVTAGGSERSGVDSNAKLRTLHRLIDHNAMDASRVLTSLMGTKDKAPSSLLNSLLLNMIAIWRCKIWVYDTNLGT